MYCGPHTEVVKSITVPLIEEHDTSIEHVVLDSADVGPSKIISSVIQLLTTSLPA